ncbi:MAG: methionine biosynthesis protein MetW [Dehalococcoidia bacterium]|jgi:methionine biosynthesis protein MetW
MTAEETKVRDLHLAPEHRLIVDLVEEGSRVLDLGCGEGDLLKALVDLKNVRGEGIELSEECIQACVAKGLRSVQHGNLDEGLATYADKSMDYVILTNTLQVLHQPLLLLREMARVGKKCIVVFPNFGHWSIRLQLAFKGRMPRTGRLPFDWYDTPNIHLTTIADFRDLCQNVPLRVVKEFALRSAKHGECRTTTFFPNLLAESALYVVEDARTSTKENQTPASAG